MSNLPTCIRNLCSVQMTGPCGGSNCLSDGGPMAALCSSRKVAAGQHLFLQDDSQNRIFLVVAGAVRLYKLFRNGRRQVIGFKYPGEFVALSREANHLFSAQAVVATELRTFPAAPFFALASQDPLILQRFFESLSASLSSAYDLAFALSQRSAEGNIAAFLLEARARSGANGSDSVFLPMSRADVADYLGIAKETVSRVLTRLEKNGWIEIRGRHHVCLKNRPALQALAR